MAIPHADTIKAMAVRGIPVAQLSIISLAKLRAKDPTELAVLSEAASNKGLFFLDLHGDPAGECVLAHLSDIYAVGEKYFSQPPEAKVKDSRLDIKPSQDLGWKEGKGAESFEISRDEMTLAGASIPQLPQLFRDEWQKITEFIAGCDEVCLTLLNSLSADFADHHRTDRPSNTGLKLVLHPSSAKLSDVGDNLHTDGGTLTLLFYKDWSIQAFLPDSNMWGFTPPMEEFPLINIADSLQRLSGEKFHSPKHRVTQLSDGAKDRHYISYFLRPENVTEDHVSAN